MAMQESGSRTNNGPRLSRKGLPPLPAQTTATTAPNGAAASIAPVPPTTATPAPNSDLGGLALAAQYPGVLDAVLRLLAAMLEFNHTNQTLARSVATAHVLSHTQTQTHIHTLLQRRQCFTWIVLQ